MILDDLGLPSSSFSLLLNLILSELLRLGGTGGGVFSIEDSDEDGDMQEIELPTFESWTGGGERYGGGCLDPDGIELSESIEVDRGTPEDNDENDDEWLRPRSNEVAGECSFECFFSIKYFSSCISSKHDVLGC